MLGLGDVVDYTDRGGNKGSWAGDYLPCGRRARYDGDGEDRDGGEDVLHDG